MVTVPRQLGPRGRRVFDLCVIAVLVLTVLGAAVSGEVAAALLGLAMTVALVWRRSRPGPAYAAVAAASVLQAVVLDVPVPSQFAYPIALYSVARYGTARAGAAALGVGLVGAVVAAWDWTRLFDSDFRTDGFASYALLIGVIVVAAWALGTLGRTRAAYVEQLVARSEQLEREAAQQAELAASDERARIAREMHDVVAHGLSVIVVQADGARYAAAQDPEVATRTLETIAGTGREALTDMRRLLGLLRSDDTGVRPQPGLADLVFLLEQASASGTDLVADLPDPLPELPEALALTAYRVVQEGLTNVRRHAGPGVHVVVRLVVADGELAVSVGDDGRGAGADGPRGDGRGLGLVGMRERVTTVGGTLDAGPRPGGGFAVDARIPL